MTISWEFVGAVVIALITGGGAWYAAKKTFKVDSKRVDVDLSVSASEQWYKHYEEQKALRVKYENLYRETAEKLSDLDRKFSRLEAKFTEVEKSYVTKNEELQEKINYLEIENEKLKEENEELKNQLETE